MSMDSENKGRYAQESDRLWAAAYGNNIDGQVALILAYESGRMSMCEEWHQGDVVDGSWTQRGMQTRQFAYEAVADLAVDEEVSA